MSYLQNTFAGIALATTCFSSVAAPRKVIAENFTATWCTYCPDVANGLIMMMEEYPDTFFPIQVHGGDSYSTTWGDARQSFYGVPGYPTVWMDGVSSQVGSYGSPSGNYNNLRSMYLQRQANYTDVTMEMCGEVVDSNTYTVSISVGIENSGTGKPMRIHCAQSLDSYPSTPSYNYSCFKQADAQLITLNPGDSETISFTFDLDSSSTANLSDVNFFAWAQATNASGPAEVYQAGKHGFNAGDCQIDTFTVGTKGDFVTIGEALTASGTGDTVRVMPGTYYENINFAGSGVTLVSIAGPEVTIIDGGGNASVVWMTGEVGETAVLDGFTIQNGHSAIGGGMFTDGTPTINNCIFKDNVAKAWGGGIGMSNASAMPVISNTRFCNNSPDDIYGDWFDAGGNVFDDSCGEDSCNADVSGDSYVNVTDLLAVIDAWGNSGGDADINGDGSVNVGDLLEVVGNWGPCP